MKFLIPTQEFIYLLNKVQNVVPQKPAQPILSTILIQAAGGMLTLTGGDMNVCVRCETDVKMFEAGSIALPARRLVPLVRELTTPNLEIVVAEGNVAHLIAGSSKFKIVGMRASDYPKLPEMTGATSLKVPQKILKDLLFRVSFAILREENQTAITGALLRISRGQLSLMGTDGKRLARAHAEVQCDPAFSGSYVVPYKAVEEIQKNLSEEGDAEILLLQDKIAVRSGSCTMITKLLAAEYPDLHRVIPEKSDLIITLHREELISLLRQVSLFTSTEHHAVKFTFTQGELHLAANTMDVGEGRVSMPVNYRGPEFQIAFSPSFFLDALRHTTEETVTLGLTDSFNPGVLTDQETASQHPHGASPLFVVMPMRVHNALT